MSKLKYGVIAPTDQSTGVALSGTVATSLGTFSTLGELMTKFPTATDGTSAIVGLPGVQSEYIYLNGSWGMRATGTDGSAVLSVSGRTGTITVFASDISDSGTVGRSLIQANTTSSAKSALVLSKADVGLPAVDNTSDAAKPVSTATQTALNAKESTSNKGVTNGYAGLDSSGLVPLANLPITSQLGSVIYQSSWNAATNTPAIPTASVGNKGWYYIVNVAGNTTISGHSNWIVGDWVVSNGTSWDYISTASLVASVAGRTGAVTLSKADVGLPAVDNTSDAAKPVSTATQTALNSKVNVALLGAASGVALLGADSKVPKNSMSTLTASDVGLPAVDNTSDANKPVSTAQAAADAAILTIAQTADLNRVPVTSIQISANRTLMVSDKGATLYNSSPTNYSISLIPGLGCITVTQTSTGTLTVTAGFATVSGVVATSSINQTVRFIELSEGVYFGHALGQMQPIVNDLITSNSSQSLSASQGVILKGLVDGLRTDVTSLQAGSGGTIGGNVTPIGVADSGAAFDNGSVSGNVLTNDTDANSDTLTVTNVTYNSVARTVGASFSTTLGSMVISANGAYAWNPGSGARALLAGQTSNEVFSYTISDGNGGSSSSALTVTVTGTNNIPSVNADNGSIAFNTTGTGNVLMNDTDPENDTLTVTQFTVFGIGGTFTPGQTATISGVGTVSVASNGAWTMVPTTGYSGSVPSVTYTISDGTNTSSGVLNLSVQTTISGVLSNPVTYALTGTRTFNVGVGQTYVTPNLVPWCTLTAGDVVNIFYSATPYNWKFALRGQGTISNPIVINGVTDASGNRPIFNFAGAQTCAGVNDGVNDIFSSTPAYGESLGGIVIKPGPGDPYRAYKPKWIQIKNLEVYGARNGATYNALGGTTPSYTSAGGLYLSPCSDILIENCLISDNGFGIFMMAKNNHIEEACERITVRSCRVFGNGVPGSYLEHNFYTQAANPIIEGCYIGQTRIGSPGSSYKSRSSGEIFRYNYVQASARACDFVHSEEQTPGIATQPDYGIDYVYGNVIENDFSLPGGGAASSIHFGGDNAGEEDGGATPFTTPEAYRTKMYFWNNTVIQKATLAQTYRTSVFQLSLSTTVAEAWNNIVYCEGNSNHSWNRMGGILNLRGVNQVFGTLTDAFDTAVAGRYAVNMLGTTLTSNPAFIDSATRDYFISSGSAAIDVGTGTPAGLSVDLSSMPVQYQPKMVSNGLVLRTPINTAIDLGATEYAVGYSPPPPPTPVNSALPTISGTFVVGNTITASPGTWSGFPTYTYQWKRDGVNISGATSSTYLTVNADASTNLSVQVTATNVTGSGNATSATNLIADPLAPTNTVAPAISGTSVVGSTLTSTSGTWTNSPTTYTYQWRRNGTNISGATSSTYLLVSGDTGTAVTCMVTASNANGVAAAASNSMNITAPSSDPDINGVYNFDKASGVDLSGVSAKWSAPNTSRFVCDGTGGLGCLSGTGSYGEYAYLIDGQGANQSAEIVVKPSNLGGGNIRADIHLSSSQVGYYITVTESGWQVRRAGIYQANDSHAINITTSGITIFIGVVDGLVTAKLNGTTVWSTTDGTPLIGGYPGFSITTDTGQEANVKIDSFKG